MSERTRATVFGEVAAQYERARPGYPDAMVADIVAGVPGGRVVEIGAGTGKATRQFAPLVTELVAIEPDPAMAAVLAQVCTRWPHVRIDATPFEAWPARPATADLVISGQAWHWVDHEKAEPECARVLLPGGVLSMGWNSWSDGVPWLRELGEISGTPEMVWNPEAFDPDVDTPPIDGFEPAEIGLFRLDQTLTVDGLVRLATSWSQTAVREDRDQVLAEVRALGERVAGDDPTFLFPYVTLCCRYRRSVVSA